MSAHLPGHAPVSGMPWLRCATRWPTPAMSSSSNTSSRFDRGRPVVPIDCRCRPSSGIVCGRWRIVRMSIVSSTSPTSSTAPITSCRRAALPQVVSVYDCWFLRHPTLAGGAVHQAGRVLRRAIEHGATVHASSASTAAEIADLFPGADVATIPLAALPVPPAPREAPIPALIGRDLHRRDRHTRTTQEPADPDRGVRAARRRARRDPAGARRRRWRRPTGDQRRHRRPRSGDRQASA